MSLYAEALTSMVGLNHFAVFIWGDYPLKLLNINKKNRSAHLSVPVFYLSFITK